MATRSAGFVGGTPPSHSVHRPSTPPAPTGDTVVLIAVLGTKAVY